MKAGARDPPFPALDVAANMLFSLFSPAARAPVSTPVRLDLSVDSAAPPGLLTGVFAPPGEDSAASIEAFMVEQ